MLYTKCRACVSSKEHLKLATAAIGASLLVENLAEPYLQLDILRYCRWGECEEWAFPTSKAELLDDENRRGSYCHVCVR